MYGGFIRLTGINPLEIPESLDSYPTLSHLFSRRINPSLRPISPVDLVCPADGKIVHVVSNVSAAHTVEIKSVKYSLEELINKRDSSSDEAWNALVVYLAPKNYHRFHAPAALDPVTIQHFTGELMSVDPWFVHRVPGLFTRNERIVVHAESPVGWLAYVAVGATCVGSIFLDNTDIVASSPTGWRDVRGRGAAVEKGGEVGGFRMGSTVVIVWSGEGAFMVGEGEDVRVGQGVWKRREEVVVSEELNE
jgi:phosphatidylserine decarboxylase